MKSQRPHNFRTDQHEIWYACSSHNMHRLTDFSVLLSKFQDDVHEVLSQSAVLPPSEKRVPSEYAPSPSVPDLQYIRNLSSPL